ncbi:hypothetical protein PHYC_03725 [Phycisphaerales bacterium]|nr:hypothetical protein PHYC_03725 [Phycisphaerales bacterium]
MPHWWVSDIWAQSHTWLIAWVAWVIVSITLHELGHGYVAMLCGDDVPLRSGHMTWNPLVHIPWPTAWVMFALFGFTWGLMPVQPANFRGRYDDAKVAFAGPAVNLILAMLCLVLVVLWVTRMQNVNDDLHQKVYLVLRVGLTINLMGFFFNLLPVPPLDGSRILADFFPRVNEIYYRNGNAVMLAFAALFFFGSRYIWALTHAVADHLMVRGIQIAGGTP